MVPLYIKTAVVWLFEQTLPNLPTTAGREQLDPRKVLGPGPRYTAGVKYFCAIPACHSQLSHMVVKPLGGNERMSGLSWATPCHEGADLCLPLSSASTGALRVVGQTVWEDYFPSLCPGQVLKLKLGRQRRTVLFLVTMTLRRTHSAGDRNEWLARKALIDRAL